ncbi:hypothetical protein Tco_0251525 [Tanacetum coccineum]
MIFMTSMIELESLFILLFDEYFKEEKQVVSKSSTVTTVDASDMRQQQPDSTSYTSTLATTVTADGNFDLGAISKCYASGAGGRTAQTTPEGEVQARKSIKSAFQDNTLRAR